MKRIVPVVYAFCLSVKTKKKKKIKQIRSKLDKDDFVTRSFVFWTLLVMIPFLLSVVFNCLEGESQDYNDIIVVVSLFIFFFE